MTLEAQIEGVLFFKAGVVRIAALAELLSVEQTAVAEALNHLEASLGERGIRLVRTDEEVLLAVAPELSETIDRIRKDELRRDIGKAGAETLAIICYRSPISRAEIDRIRGVNSSAILRSLMVRGLVERRANPEDSRASIYAATADLYAHLGITTREELPDFVSVMDALDAFEAKGTPESTPV